METTFIRTDELYREVFEADDRQAAFRLRFVEPWKSMLSLFARGPGADADGPDLTDAAREWNWLMPEDFPERADDLESLAALARADAWERCREALAAAANRFDPYDAGHGIPHITGWLVLGDPKRSDPIMRGYTGATDWTQPRFILQFDTPNEYNLARLEGMTIHETHHLIRFRAHPFNPVSTTVADYVVAEGTAEAFAASLYGEEVMGYYVTDFDEASLDTARALIGKNLGRTGFNEIRSLVFGDHWAREFDLPVFGMPAYGGYAVGYRAVRAYLERTGKSIEETTFLPGEEICRESGFFG